MAYEFRTLNDTFLISFHNIPEAVNYLKNKEGFNTRGYSLRTLRAFDFDEQNEYIKGGYKLVRVDGNYKQRTILKEFKNMTNTPGQYEVRQGIIDFIEIEKKRGRETYINTNNLINFKKYIEGIIRQLPNKENLFISFVLTYEENGNIRHWATTYNNYNECLINFINRLTELLNEYEDNIRFQTLTIKYYQKIHDQEIIIFKQLNNIVKTNKYHIINDFKKLNPASFFNDIKKAHQIISPSTYKNCFLKTFLMFIENDESTPKYGVLNHRVFKKLKLTNTLKDTTDILKILYKLTKKIYTATIYIYNGFDIMKYEYKIFDTNDKTEDIKILVKGSHAHLMNFKKDFKLIDIKEHEEENINKGLITYTEKKTILDPQILTYDFETISDPETGKTTPYALGIFNGKKYTEIYKRKIDSNIINDFITYINTIKTDSIFYGHNAGKFDMLILVETLLKNFEINKYLDSNGRIINLNFRNKNDVSISFRDSYNFIVCSLNKACADFKTTIKKLNDSVKHDLINLNNSYTESKLKIENKTIHEYTSAYLKNDCLSLHEILLKFNDIIYKTYKFTLWSVYTNAGIAREVFLKNFYEVDKTPLYYLRRDIDAELRHYYFGGRNEVFKTLGATKKKLYYVDFTSLYPYKMYNEYYPVGEMEIIIPENENKFCNNWFGFVEVEFKHTNINNKIKPFHPVKHNGKLIFGNVKTYQKSIFTTEEIKYSIKNKLGYTYRFKKVYHYKEKSKLFNGIVGELFKMKSGAEEKENEALRQIAKIIINSLYGFWGINYYQRNQNIIKCDTIKNKKGLSEEEIKIKVDKNKSNVLMGYLTENKLINHTELHGHSLYQIEDEIKPNGANVGLAFMICAYARTELYKLMRAIEINNGVVYYCDTDSVITDLNIYEVKEIHDEFIRTDNKLIGELTNEARPYVEKLLKNAGISKNEINVFVKTNTPAFTELITIANKFYYLGLEFEYKNIKYNYEIMKGKGVNLNNKYNIKYEENKIIYFKEINNKGQYGMTRDDYIKLSNGYTVNFDTMTFKGGFKECIMNEKGLLKLDINKNIVKIYDKGELINNDITTFNIE
jgi:hypothetical protein